MQQPPRKPALYHGTPEACTGDEMRPGKSYTTVHTQFKGTEQESEHVGEFVFATSDLNLSYAYALRLKDRDRKINPNVGDSTYNYVVLIGNATMAGGNKLPYIVITEKEDYLKRMGDAKPTIYRMPQSNDFMPVLDRYGDPVPIGEWKSRTPQPLDQCQPISVDGIDDAMRHGVQVFFLGPQLHPQFFQQEMKRGIMQASNLLATNGMLPGIGDYDHLIDKNSFHVIDNMVRQHYAEHYNRTCNICPVDLQSMEFAPTDKPAGYSGKAGDPGRKKGTAEKQ